MKRGVSLYLLLLLLSSAAFADVLLSLPKIANRETRYIEVGSSPKVTFKYRNAYSYSVWISAAEIYLRYDPTAVDGVVSINHVFPDNFRETEMDISTPGEIRYKFETPIANWRPIKVDPGQSVELANVIAHVNQSAASRWINLLTWSATIPCRIAFKTSDITRAQITPESVSLLPSKPPAFSGLTQASSANSIGRQNIGNTVFLNWKSGGGGATDYSRYFNGKVSFRVRRNSTSYFGPGSSAVELPIEEPSHDPGDDPARRTPYTGNVSGSDYLYQDGPGTGVPSDSDPLNDGTTYWYQVTAVDDTSPNPNENSGTTVLGCTPVDFTPPEEVRNLTARAEDRKITLTWENPTDADVAGVVIMRNEESPVGSGSLGSASGGPPYSHGPEYYPDDVPTTIAGGKIIYVSSPGENPTQYEDFSVENGVLYHYKIFTYDVAEGDYNSDPALNTLVQLGRNYSNGLALSKTAGTPPLPITNFVATKGIIAGEVIFSWNNSESDFCDGVLIRYTTDERLRYAALRDERSGEIAGWFPAMAGPGATESVSLSMLPGRNYYFKAFAYNRTAEEFDPTIPENMARHLFSTGQLAAVALPQEAYEDVFSYTYNFQRGINHFAVPFPSAWMVDEAGSTIDISTWAKLTDELNRQSGENVVLTFGRWNEVTQKAEGIVSIDYTKAGMDRFSTTSGVTPDTPVMQGGAYEISVAAPFTFTMRAVRPTIR
jgi:hypothetical protein